MAASKDKDTKENSDKASHETRDNEIHGEGNHEADQRYRKRTKEFLETQEGAEASETSVEQTDEEKEEDKAAREKALKKARH